MQSAESLFRRGRADDSRGRLGTHFDRKYLPRTAKNHVSKLQPESLAVGSIVPALRKMREEWGTHGVLV